MDRAAFLKAAAAAHAAAAAKPASKIAPGSPAVPPSMRGPGGPIPPYGKPSVFEASVARSPPDATMVAVTPLGDQQSAITPNGLFFTRNHAGVARIDPATHRLLVHGLVKTPLVFTMADLMRLPSVTRTHFIECSGNSEPLWQGGALTSVGVSHGLASCAVWTGVPLRVVLEAVGAQPEAAWMLAEGADGAGYDRSFPLSKALDDSLLVYGQNGEMLRPEQGFPLRLLLPGWEGNTNVKWLRRLELGAKPFGEREELHYAELLPGGMSREDDSVMQTKSIVTQPSVGDRLGAHGEYEVRGFAWSGNGAITRVDVTLDGGATSSCRTGTASCSRRTRSRARRCRARARRPGRPRCRREAAHDGDSCGAALAFGAMPLSDREAVLAPGLYSTGEIRRRESEVVRELALGLRAAAARLAHHDDVAVARNLALTFRELTERDEHGTVDMAVVPFVRLAHVDDKRARALAFERAGGIDLGCFSHGAVLRTREQRTSGLRRASGAVS